MIRRKAVRLLTIPLIFIVSLFAGCRDNWRSHEDRAEKTVKYLTMELGLDEKQKKYLNDLVIGFMTKKEEVFDRNLIVNEFTAQLNKEEIDREYLKNIVDAEIRKIEEALHALLDQVAYFHGALTTEQRAELAELIKRTNNHGHRRHGKYDSK